MSHLSKRTVKGKPGREEEGKGRQERDIPTNNVQGLSFLHILTNICSLLSFSLCNDLTYIKDIIPATTISGLTMELALANPK